MSSRVRMSEFRFEPRHRFRDVIGIGLAQAPRMMSGTLIPDSKRRQWVITVAHTYLPAKRLLTCQVSLSTAIVPSGLTLRMKWIRPAVMGKVCGTWVI